MYRETFPNLLLSSLHLRLSVPDWVRQGRCGGSRGKKTADAVEENLCEKWEENLSKQWEMYTSNSGKKQRGIERKHVEAAKGNLCKIQWEICRKICGKYEGKSAGAAEGNLCKIQWEICRKICGKYKGKSAGAAEGNVCTI